MLLLNYFPFLHLCLLTLLIYVTKPIGIHSLLIALIGVYIFPPVLTRLLFFFRPISDDSINIASPDFLTWWGSLQFQVIFCRLPFLEEALRIVPGLYSVWLRLWGAKIGRFTYWAAGTLILDRTFLQIGDDVVFGAGVRLNSHVIQVNEIGERQLLLSKIEIGDRCHIGGYSLLTAGTRIESDETTKAFLISPPFSHWQNGRRIHKSSDSRVSAVTPIPTPDTQTS